MGWTHDEVVAAVRSVIEGHVEPGAADVTERTELVGDLGIDSLGVMEVVAEIEDEFDLTIADRELRNVTTLGDVVEAIEARLREQGRFSR